MLLTVASLLTAFGFATWIVGSIFEYHGLAFAGAAIIVGAGAWIMVTGLEVEAGTTAMNVSANETATKTQYEAVQSPFSNFSVGAMVLLVGAVGGLRSLEELS